MQNTVKDAIHKLCVIDIKLPQDSGQLKILDNIVKNTLRTLKDKGDVFTPCSCGRQLLVFHKDVIPHLPKELKAYIHSDDPSVDHSEYQPHQRMSSILEPYKPRYFLGNNAYRHLLGYLSGTETLELGDPHVLSDARDWWGQFCKEHVNRDGFDVFFNPIFSALFEDASNIRGKVDFNNLEPSYSHCLLDMVDMKGARKVIVIAPEEGQAGPEVAALRQAIWLLAGANPKRKVPEIIISHSNGAVAKSFCNSLYSNKRGPNITSHIWSCALADLLPGGPDCNLSQTRLLLMGCPLANPNDDNQTTLENDVFCTWSNGRKHRPQSRIVFMSDDQNRINENAYLRSMALKIIARDEVKGAYKKAKDGFYHTAKKAHAATYLFTHARTLGIQVDATRIVKALEKLLLQEIEAINSILQLDGAGFKGQIGALASNKPFANNTDFNHPRLL